MNYFDELQHFRDVASRRLLSWKLTQKKATTGLGVDTDRRSGRSRMSSMKSDARDSMHVTGESREVTYTYLLNHYWEM